MQFIEGLDHYTTLEAVIFGFVGDTHSSKSYKYFISNITEIPKGIRLQHKLRTLGFQLADVRSIPPWINELRELSYITLMFNNVIHIPPMIYSMTQLRVIDVQHNAIAYLPVHGEIAWPLGEAPRPFKPSLPTSGTRWQLV